MFRASKPLKIVVFTLLTAALLMAVINLNVPTIKGQTQATVNILPSEGGTTDPAAGTTTYSDGTVVTITATADSGFAFNYWIVNDSTGAINTYPNNPVTITVSGGVTYTAQAAFQVITYLPAGTPTSPPTPASPSTNAVVVVLAGVGGTTSPVPGIYSLANATSLDLTATPDSGWTFDHWVISGAPLNGHGAYSYTLTPTNNPYNVNHGYGNTYDYQPVFSPVSTSPTVNEFSSATAILMAAILVLVAFGTYVFTKRTKK